MFSDTHLAGLQFALVLKHAFTIRVFDLLTEQQRLLKQEHVTIFAFLQNVLRIEHCERILQQDLPKRLQAALLK